MTVGPGGTERARVSVKLVPDTSTFGPEAEAELERIASDLTLEVNIKGAVDADQVRREVNEALNVAQAGIEDLNATVNAEINLEGLESLAVLRNQNISIPVDLEVNADPEAIRAAVVTLRTQLAEIVNEIPITFDIDQLEVIARARALRTGIQEAVGEVELTSASFDRAQINRAVRDAGEPTIKLKPQITVASVNAEIRRVTEAKTIGSVRLGVRINEADIRRAIGDISGTVRLEPKITVASMNAEIARVSAAATLRQVTLKPRIDEDALDEIKAVKVRAEFDKGATQRALSESLATARPFIRLSPQITVASVNAEIKRVQASATLAKINLEGRFSRAQLQRAVKEAVAAGDNVKITIDADVSNVTGRVKQAKKEAEGEDITIGAKAKEEDIRRAIERANALLGNLERSIELEAIDPDDLRINRVRNTIERLLRNIPISFQDAEAIAELRTRLSRIPDVKIDVDADTTTSQQAIDNLQNRINRVTRLFEFDADISSIERELARLNAERERIYVDLEIDETAKRKLDAQIDQLNADFTLEVDDQKAEAAINELQRAIDRVDKQIQIGATYEDVKVAIARINREKARIIVDFDLDDTEAARVNALVDGLNRFTEDSTRESALKRFQRSFSDINRSLQQFGLGSSFAQRQFTLLVLAIGPAIAALVVAFSTLVSVIGNVAGALALITPTALVGVAAGVAVLGTTISQITQAYQDLTQAQDDTTSGAARAAIAIQQASLTLRRANRELADANRDLASAQTEAVTGQIEANQEAAQRTADISKTIADGIRDVQQATISLQRAELAEIRAQERVNDARERAIDQLRQLEDAVRNAAIGEINAEASLARARQRLNEALRSYDTEAEELRAAQLDVQAAELGVVDAREDSIDAQNDYNKAQGRTVDEIEAVQDALLSLANAEQERIAAQFRLAEAQEQASEREIEARKRAQDATEAAARFSIDSARRIEDAQLRVEDAILGVRSAQLGLQDANARSAASTGAVSRAFNDLSSAGQGLVQFFIGFTPQLKQLNKDFQQAFLEPISEPLQAFLGNSLDTLQVELPKFARILGEGVASTLDIFGSERAQGVLSETFSSVNEALRAAQPAIDNFSEAIVTVLDVAGPKLPVVIALIADLLNEFAAFLEKAASDGSLEKFLDDGIASFDELLSIARDLGGILVSLFVSSNDSGQTLLQTIGDLISDFNDFLSTPEGRDEVITLFKETVYATILLLQNLPSIIRLLADIVIIGTYTIRAFDAILTFLAPLSYSLDILRDIGQALYEIVELALRIGMIDLTKGLFGEDGFISDSIDAFRGFDSSPFRNIWDNVNDPVRSQRAQDSLDGLDEKWRNISRSFGRDVPTMGFDSIGSGATGASFNVADLSSEINGIPSPVIDARQFDDFSSAARGATSSTSGFEAAVAGINQRLPAVGRSTGSSLVGQFSASLTDPAALAQIANSTQALVAALAVAFTDRARLVGQISAALLVIYFREGLTNSGRLNEVEIAAVMLVARVAEAFVDRLPKIGFIAGSLTSLGVEAGFKDARSTGAVRNGAQLAINTMATVFGDSAFSTGYGGGAAAAYGIGAGVLANTSYPKQVANYLIGTMFNNANLYDVGYRAGQSVVDGFSAGLQRTQSLASSAYNMIKSLTRFLPGSPAEEGPLSGQGYSLLRGQRMVEDFAYGISSRRGEVRSAALGVAGVAAIDGSMVGSAATSVSVSGISLASALEGLRLQTSVDETGLWRSTFKGQQNARRR